MSRPSQQPGPDDEEYILVAQLFNARNLTNILKAIHFKETSTCFLSANGIKVTVESAKCVQANAFIQAGIFHEFNFNEDCATFRINLDNLLACLDIFGSVRDNSITTALKMCYAGHGSPLVLMLEEGGVVTDCSVQTEEPDEALDFDFKTSNVVNKIIMQSSWLKEVFHELDMTSEVLEILMSPDSPYFRLSTFGHAGSAHVDFPNDSEQVEKFECTKTQTNRYKITLLKPSTKALNISSKISIRMDNRGFLSLQYMILNDDRETCYVEYLCAPDEESNDEESNENGDYLS
ncbi:cell cycle checkpoint protein RAD1-like [Dendronephthya gigantea]|uniref:cell cycle checkpoint protein RAD1-like n=1 Tax=Dendronephthya gigantea TaxID=151771 RepID=UPI00106B598F|nr:cell cycle checkpoint protein RAD1-like [Dendronephthya gigantea]